MSLYVLDTDTLSLFSRGDALVTQKILSTSPLSLAVSIITVEEQISGWYDVLRKATTDERLALGYASLGQSIELLQNFRILPFTRDAIRRYRELLELKTNVRKMDLRITAIALEFEAILVTRNLRDFSRVPGLQIEDWSQ